MKTATAFDWPAALQARTAEMVTDSDRLWLKRIWSCNAAGQQWAYATNGNALLAVPGIQADDHGSAITVKGHIEMDLPSAERTTVRALLDLTHIRLAVFRSPKCLECEGSGYYSNTSKPCGDCGGTGIRNGRKIRGETFRQTMLPKPFAWAIQGWNRLICPWVLFGLLHGLPNGRVWVRYDDDPEHALRLEGQGWIGLLMPMRPPR